jgi:outer membrane protein
VAALAMAAALVFPVTISAQTLEEALRQAYENNPTLNAQRAALRAIDENVPRALSGYRPTITASGDYGWLRTRTVGAGGVVTRNETNPAGGSLNLSQNLFAGFRTMNEVRSAQSEVAQARETLRDTEQAVLLAVVTVFMDVLRDEALVELQRQNLEALREQLRATRDRFNVGEVTRTDVALAEAAAAGAQSSLIQAQSNLAASRAEYHRVVGKSPGRLVPGRPIDHLLPKTQQAVIDIGLAEHPNVMAGEYAVDVAAARVKIAEGALLPTVDASAAVSRNLEPGGTTSRVDAASAAIVATVPIYQRGAEYANVRQAKETLGELRLRLDSARDLVRSNIVQFWTQSEAARALIEAARTQVNAQKIALDGVTEEYKVGQRTILDVLNSRALFVTAQSNLVVAQRSRVVTSYSVLSAIGRLDAERLQLKVATYDPTEHFQQVRDRWIGLRTPDGR